MIVNTTFSAKQKSVEKKKKKKVQLKVELWFCFSMIFMIFIFIGCMQSYKCQFKVNMTYLCNIYILKGQKKLLALFKVG